jgi:copper chaperone CopZ
MKSFNHGTALLGLSILLAAGCATSDIEREPQINPVPRGTSSELSELPPILEQDAELVVFGLSCPLCASNLETQFRRIPGIAGHRMDLDTGVIHLQVRQGGCVPTGSVKRAVEDAGFTLQSIRLAEAP